MLLIPWNVIFVIFSFGLWTLWQHRNRVVFLSRTPNQGIHSVVITRAAEYFFCHNQAAVRPRLEKVIRWVRPERGWFKINTDGSSIGNPGNAGGGVILRADNEAWIKAFSRNIGHITSLLTEL